MQKREIDQINLELITKLRNGEELYPWALRQRCIDHNMGLARKLIAAGGLLNGAHVTTATFNSGSGPQYWQRFVLAGDCELCGTEIGPVKLNKLIENEVGYFVRSGRSDIKITQPSKFLVSNKLIPFRENDASIAWYGGKKRSGIA